MATEEQPAETKFRRAFEELSGKAANTKEERARRRDFARRIVTNDDHCLDACLALNFIGSVVDRQRSRSCGPERFPMRRRQLPISRPLPPGMSAEASSTASV